MLAAILNPAQTSAHGSIDIYNSNSWDRTEVVFLSPDESSGGDHVLDSAGHPVPSQRLACGDLAVLVRDVPAFGCVRYTLSPKAAHHDGDTVHVRDGVLENGVLRVSLDAETGDIVELTLRGVASNFVDRDHGSLNQYLYLEGRDIAHLGHSGFGHPHC